MNLFPHLFQLLLGVACIPRLVAPSILIAPSLTLTFLPPPFTYKDPCYHVEPTPVTQESLSLEILRLNICRAPFTLQGNTFIGSRD